ncbi:DUF5926 family protein [Dermacoccaceae bacterium W4C1]
MGKASRRKAQNKAPKDPSTQPPPYVTRPFADLPGETEWVAMREIIPAATAPLAVTVDGADQQVTIATVLPLAWAGLRRDNGDTLVALQAGAGSGDLSRDIAQALLAASATEVGNPVATAPRASAASPRLQDLIADDTPLRAQVHEGFDFWVEGADLDAESRDSLERANASAAPTVRLEGVDSAFWCQIGDRTYVRWVLGEDENKATDALARLHATGDGRLGDGRLLGAFRACGLLVPVWEIDTETAPEALHDPIGELAKRYQQALAVEGALSAEERRARNGFVSRQITLR